MLYPVPFKAEDYFTMDLQNAQAWTAGFASLGDLRTLENEWATTLMDDGVPLVCAGAAEYWEGRAHVWAVVSDRVNVGNFRGVHAQAKAFLDGLPFRRLEAAVECDFDAGHRWVKALGFTLEALRLRKYQVNGDDCALYARVKE